MQWSALAALPSFFHLKAVEYEIWATAKTEEDQRREWCNKSEISATGLHLDVVRTATRDSDSTFTPDFEPRARLHDRLSSMIEPRFLSSVTLLFDPFTFYP